MTANAAGPHRRSLRESTIEVVEGSRVQPWVAAAMTEERPTRSVKQGAHGSARHFKPWPMEQGKAGWAEAWVADSIGCGLAILKSMSGTLSAKVERGTSRISGGEPASAPTLARVTYERLRADVLAGHWQPGRKLLMHELRDRYQVGASPLREALNRLASEEWVVHNDQRGFVVAQATQAQLDDLVATRIAIESLAIGQAFERRTAAWEEQLVVAFHRLSRTPRSVSPDSYEENPDWERQHREFHMALLAGCGSELLLNFCSQLYDQAYRFRQLAARAAYKRRNELDEHRAIFDAVMSARLDEAVGLLSAHYRRTASIFERGDAS